MLTNETQSDKFRQCHEFAVKLKSIFPHRMKLGFSEAVFLSQKLLKVCNFTENSTYCLFITYMFLTDAGKSLCWTYSGPWRHE